MHAATLLAAILITSIAVMGQLYQVEARRKFVEHDAWLIVLLGIASLGMLYFIS